MPYGNRNRNRRENLPVDSQENIWRERMGVEPTEGFYTPQRI